MNNERVLALIRECGALEANPKIIPGLKKPSVTFSAERVFQSPENAKTIMREMALLVRDKKPDLVVGVRHSSIIPAYELAAQLGAQCAYAQRKNQTMSISRAFEVKSGCGTLIVADAVQTGQNVRMTVEMLRALNVKILGICAIVDLSGGSAAFRFPFYSLVTL